jgi:hypothetical protein
MSCPEVPMPTTMTFLPAYFGEVSMKPVECFILPLKDSIPGITGIRISPFNPVALTM